jgi:hypothetical protein
MPFHALLDAALDVAETQALWKKRERPIREEPQPVNG